MKRLTLCCVAGAFLLAVGAVSQTATPSAGVDFSRDIHPIFVKSCESCHGAKVQMAGLRLDNKSAALAKVVAPGNAAHSSLYMRVAGIGDQARMPMGGRLSAAEIDSIRRWIDAGANWPDTAGALAATVAKHWAFVPPVRPALPSVKNAAWSAMPIDRFVLARLEQEHLAPSPQADRITLLRRASLDLIGLPPSPEEVDAFVADRSPNAYERQVDRLLASPHYGERWGRVWLDAARYADSDGYEKDKQRWVWFYRDWVINALNSDMPYDRFIIDQVAGDLIPNATQDQIVATGFLRNSMVNEEGGIEPEQFRMEGMFDRMDAIGKGVLGVTIQCAQCHNHKFDPLTQEEYYRLFAFLNNSNEGSAAVYTKQEQMKRSDLFRQMREIETALQHRTHGWEKQMAAWEESVKGDQPEWTVLRPEVDDISTGGQKYVALKDGSFLAQGYAPTKHTAKLTVKTDLQNISGFRLELLTDGNLPLTGPGRSLKGSAALTEFRVTAAPASAPDQPVDVKIVKATADVNPPETPLDPMFDDKSGKRRVTGPIEFAIDGKDETAWSTDAGPGLRNQSRKAVFTPEKPISNASGTVLTFYLKQNHGGWNSDDNQSHNMGRLRLSVTAAASAAADPLPKNVRESLAVRREQRSPAQAQAVFSYWRTTVSEWKDENQAIAALWRQMPEGSSQLVLNARQATGDDMRETHILTRGDFRKPAALVTPGVPGFLNPLPADAPPTRLSFAKWLVDRKSPTTARAFVNRMWQAYFGTGIVPTPEDLGRQSEMPSHPELLDWMAVEFMDRGWSMKAMHKLIVTSEVYKQSSRVMPEMLERDPYNRLLARGPRFRVDAEIVRDIALAASGLLNEKVGGPSVFAPAPEFLFVPPSSYGPKIWNTAKGEDRYRRALYTFRYRSVPYPMLQTFDSPVGDTSCVRRARSNTPLQALTTLNETLSLEAARGLAIRTLRDGGSSDAQRLEYAFRRCTARPPDEREKAELLSFLSKQAKRVADGWLSAPDLAGLDEGNVKMPQGSTPAQVAAWTAVSRVLLNLDETITKE